MTHQLYLFPYPIPYTMAINSDCKKALSLMAAKGMQVDSIVTDPPYELGFMGKAWDKTGIAYDQELWSLCLQVLKPGGHLLAFGGSRTYHRMACAIEDAGFEIRDQIMWLHGQGFPKSLNVSKALDKMAGAQREVIGTKKLHDIRSGNLLETSQGLNKGLMEYSYTVPATEAAQQWEGWGSALKPAHEPICMARKPLSEKNIAENVLKHGTGGINIDGCRIGFPENEQFEGFKDPFNHVSKGDGSLIMGRKSKHTVQYKPLGRFPANIIHDGSDEVMDEFAKYGELKSNPGTYRKDSTFNPDGINFCPTRKKGSITSLGDTGTAARFFYAAKASKKDRCGSKHPTVKPISLMRYLCRLVTPQGGIVLDPFAGTGTTGKAAQEEGFHAVLIEREAEYFKDLSQRIYREDEG